MDPDSVDRSDSYPLEAGHSHSEKQGEGNMSSESSSDSQQNIVYLHGTRFWLISLAYV